LEAAGLMVAPGFIDAHSHADGGLLEAPDAESQIRQGITTGIIGQDGGSRIPLATLFSDLARRRVALNLASFVGHGAVRRAVMGADYRRGATPAEIARMSELVDQEMRAGALGLSSGLEYDPGFYAATDEVVALARRAAAHGGLYISHMRNEDNTVLDSVRELVRIAREAGIPAQVSHIKLGSKRVWGKADEVFRMMAEARSGAGAPEITADVYPYLYWQSTITLLNPSRDWENRSAWEGGLADVGGPENVLLARYGPDPTWAGRTIAQISAATGQDPVAVMQEVVRKTRGPLAGAGGEAVVVTAMSEGDLRKFIADPHTMFCSDGGPRSPHPRSAGSYPRILGRYVREEKVLSLEEAIRKMTSFPARRMGLTDRGTIAPEMKADLVLFDPLTVQDTATTSDPKGRPLGIPHVMVNGVPVLEQGRMTGARPGRPITRAR
jgi:N-acyl-D-amino-acid deacylase